MITVTIEKLDEVYLRVFSEPSVEQELVDFFTYEYPGARFTPKFKARLWDGKVRLYDPLRKTIYVGLLNYIEAFCERNDYQISFKTRVRKIDGITNEMVDTFAKELEPCSRGKPITIYDYQIDAVKTALDEKRTLLLSPTASGKSFIIYTTMVIDRMALAARDGHGRWYLGA